MQKNFGEIKPLTEANDWDGLAGIMIDAAKRVERAGADCLLIGANTMHKIAAEIQEAVKIPIIHIGAATADTIKNTGLKKVALLGTKYTMQLDFYKAKLAEYGIETLIPGEKDTHYINRSIYDEFSMGTFLSETKKEYLKTSNLIS